MGLFSKRNVDVVLQNANVLIRQDLSASGFKAVNQVLVRINKDEFNRGGVAVIFRVNANKRFYTSLYQVVSEGIPFKQVDIVAVRTNFWGITNDVLAGIPLQVDHIKG